MGKSYRAVSFFTDDISITPHTATEVKYLSRPVTLREFSEGQGMSLQICDETGEYLVKRVNTDPKEKHKPWDFMEGPES